jgi:hypothetical protein
LPASSPTSSPSLRLELRPSRRLTLALLLLAAAAAAAVLLSRLPTFTLLLVPAALVGALWQLQRVPRGALVLHASGMADWWGERSGGLGQDVGRELGPDVRTEPCVVELLGLEPRGPFAVLSLRIRGRVVRWPAASDTLPPAQLRLLRLWLARHSAPAQPLPTPQGPA